MSLLDRPPVFIVGAQRGGTTWVQRLLCDHPLIAGGQESHLFSGYLAPLWQRWQVEHGMRDAGNRTIGLGCYLTEDELLDEMRHFCCRAFGKLERAKPGATLLVEKTPDHALHLPLIRRVFPEATILHVLRDGRDVAASLLDASRRDWGRGWTPTSAGEAAQRWVDWVRAIRCHLGDFPRSLTVRYEELVEDGPHALARLFDFLGLPLPSVEVEAIHDRWRFEECASRSAGDSLLLGGACEGSQAREPAGFYRKGRAGGWRDDLSPDELRAVEAVAGPLLRELGYEQGSPLPTATESTTSAVTDIAEAVRRFPRWHYQFDLGGVKTPVLDPSLVNRHEQRKRHLFAPLLRVLGRSLAGKRVLDLGCNAGFWSLAAAEAGADFVLGIDGRAMHVEQAELVFRARGIDAGRYQFRLTSVFDLDPAALGTFDVVLCLGLLYHTCKPMEMLERAAAMSGDLLVIDTNLSARAGSCLDLSHEPLDDPRNACDYELVVNPTREAVLDMVRQLDYRAVVLAPTFTSWEGAEDYRDGTRRVFLCARQTALTDVPAEWSPAAPAPAHLPDYPARSLAKALLVKVGRKLGLTPR